MTGVETVERARVAKEWLYVPALVVVGIRRDAAATAVTVAGAAHTVARHDVIASTHRIALIHALAHSIAPVNAELDRAWPGCVRMHLLDDSLSTDLAASDSGLTTR